LVAKTPRVKHYGEIELQQLLGRVVAVSQPTATDDADGLTPMASVRQVYAELLRAPIGDMRVADQVIDRLQHAHDDAVQKIRDRLRLVFALVSVGNTVRKPLRRDSATTALQRARLRDEVRKALADEVIDLQKVRTLSRKVFKIISLMPTYPPLDALRLSARVDVRVLLHEREEIELTGTPDGVIFLRAALLVRRVGRDRIRECDCLHRFVAVGKRQFCSTACQKRVYMRRFRAGEVGDIGDE
jgi:hypothetical protein